MQPINTHQLTDSTSSTSGNLSVSQNSRGTWLKAMEASGLYDALKNTRNFPGATSLPQGQSASAPLSDPIHHDIAERLAQANAVRTAPAITPARTGIFKGNFVDNGSASILSQADRSVVLGCAEFPIEGSAGLEAGDSPQAPAVNTSEQLKERRRWPHSQVTATITEDGRVEVWVRDTAITGAQMQMLLAELRTSAGVEGKALAKVSLNGAEIYSTNENGSIRESSQGEK